MPKCAWGKICGDVFVLRIVVDYYYAWLKIKCMLISKYFFLFLDLINVHNNNGGKEGRT